jgi:hypothetical protein
MGFECVNDACQASDKTKVLVFKLTKQTIAGSKGAGMTITQHQSEQMLEAAKPLIKWLNENCHPHCAVHVDQRSAELVEAVAMVKTDDYLNGHAPETKQILNEGVEKKGGLNQRPTTPPQPPPLPQSQE